MGLAILIFAGQLVAGFAGGFRRPGGVSAPAFSPLQSLKRFWRETTALGLSIIGHNPTTGTISGSWRYQYGEGWAYQLSAEQPGEGSTRATAAYIRIDPANRNPTGSDANSYIWLGSAIRGLGMADGFIQVGYEVKPGNQFALFAYSDAPKVLISCAEGAQIAWAGDGCEASLAAGNRAALGGSYWVQAEAQQDAIVLAVNGWVIMRIAYPPAAEASLGIGYAVAEISAGGMLSPADTVKAGLDLRGEVAAIEYREAGAGDWLPLGSLDGRATIFAGDAELRDAESDVSEGNALCPPFAQIGGFNGRPDSYRAGSYGGGVCLPAGGQLTQPATGSTDSPAWNIPDPPALPREG